MFQNLEEDLVAYHLDLLQEKRVTLVPVLQHKERYDINELITKTNCVCQEFRKYKNCTNFQPTSQFSKKANKTVKKPDNTDYKTNDSPKHTLVQDQSVKESEDTDHNDHIEDQSISSKKPIPTPRSLLQANVPLVTP